MGKLTVVVGGQYGSEGKGAITAWLGTRSARPVGVRVAGPNAGHTVIGPDDLMRTKEGPGCAQAREWKLRSVPVLAVSNPGAPLVIAAGSEVDLEVLMSEVNELDAAGYHVSERLLIDKTATVLDERYITEEKIDQITERLGSTAKGIGAARAARIWRKARQVMDLESSEPVRGVDTTGYLLTALEDGDEVIIEGTQGFGLGLHAGNYPYCTSSDCRAIDFMAMAGLSPWDTAVTETEVWVVLRTRPIRVAGNSGRIEGETSWTELGLPEERTTVTNKIRRVGEWDRDLAADAVNSNGGANCKVAITMLDQMFPEIAGAVDIAQLSADSLAWVAEREKELGGAKVWAVGTSPSTVVELL